MDYLVIALYSVGLVRTRLLIPALAVHAYLIGKTAATFGRIPLIGMHDTLGFLAFATGIIVVIAGWNRPRDLFTLIAVPLMLVLLAGSAISPPVPAHALPPVLKTVWFELHVILSFVAYAFFAVGAVYGILSLSREGAAAERSQYRSLLLGYVLFSTAMVFGGIWAFLAWGTYWLWTPKELWTTIVWFFYSLYLHARLVRGWTGPKVIWMGIIGFVVVLFTYAGVGLLMKSSHEF